jgi:hypothetical protein
MNEPGSTPALVTLALPAPASPYPVVDMTVMLESVPLHSPRQVETLLDSSKATGCYVHFPSSINLYCKHETCGGVRRHNWEREFGASLFIWDRTYYAFVAYACTNCLASKQVFGLKSVWNGKQGASGVCTKIYQEPPFGPPIPSRVFSIIGDANRECFLQARRAIARGFGIGAYAYYRRIVENTKFDLVTSVLDVAVKTNAPAGQVGLLRKAQKETQFSKAMEMLNDVAAIPPSLLIRGHNPLALLHDALSEGIHQLDDDECLKRAEAAEVILCELARSMQAALAERKEVEAALSSIMKRKSGS